MVIVHPTGCGGEIWFRSFWRRGRGEAAWAFPEEGVVTWSRCTSNIGKPVGRLVLLIKNFIIYIITRIEVLIRRLF